MEKAKEIWVINPTTFQDNFRCGIVELYDRIAKMIFGKTFDHYDCTKIEVGRKILDAVEAYYIEQGMDKAEFGMMWVCYGPKATLDDYNVQVETDWATDDKGV